MSKMGFHCTSIFYPCILLALTSLLFFNNWFYNSKISITLSKGISLSRKYSILIISTVSSFDNQEQNRIIAWWLFGTPAQSERKTIFFFCIWISIHCFLNAVKNKRCSVWSYFILRLQKCLDKR